MAEQNIDITFDEATRIISSVWAQPGISPRVVRVGLPLDGRQDNRIRVMPKEKFKQTEQLLSISKSRRATGISYSARSLEAECHGFADKIQAPVLSNSR